MKRTESSTEPRSPEWCAIDWASWQPGDRATLTFVLRDAEILLIRKKRGLGAGKINGPGGRIEPGESKLECAIREVEEELCVTPQELRACGELSYQFCDGYSIHVSVFTARGPETGTGSGVRPGGDSGVATRVSTIHTPTTTPAASRPNSIRVRRFTGSHFPMQ